jgi:hypothetical protein
MPAFQYWITGTSLFLAGSFVFTVAVGLIGIREMISHKAFMILMVFAVALSFLAWRTAAKQEEVSATQETHSRELENKIGDLNSQLATIAQSNKKQEDQLSNVVAQNKEFEDNLAKIANAANLNPNQSTQALADQIINKLGAIDKRLTSVENPPRENNKLYQGKNAVALVLGIVQNGNSVTLQRISSSAPLDFSTQFFLQQAILNCAAAPPSGDMVAGAEHQIIYFNLSCQIVGLAPQP